MPVRGLHKTFRNQIEENAGTTSVASNCVASSNSSMELTAELCNDEPVLFPSTESIAYHHRSKIGIEESKRLGLPEIIENLPRGMSWLLESGRKKREVQSQENRGMFNAQCTSIPSNIAFETPAKPIHQTLYITPQNKNTQFTFHKEVNAGGLEVIQDSPPVPQDKENVELPRTCNKPDSLHINDSGVGVSSFYSNTKTTRSVAVTSEYPSHNRQTPLMPQDEYQINPVTSSHSIMGGRHIKRIALHEKFTYETNVMIQGESKSGKWVPNIKDQLPSMPQNCQHPKPSQHYHPNNDKENNIHLVPLDLSDKVSYHCNEHRELTDNVMALDLSDRLKEFKSNKRKESVPTVLESKKLTDMNYHRNEDEQAIKPTIEHYPFIINQPLRTAAPLQVPVRSVVGPTISATCKVAPNNYKPSLEIELDAMEVKPSYHTPCHTPSYSMPASKQPTRQCKPNVHSQPNEIKPSFQHPRPKSKQGDGQLKSSIHRQSNEETLDMYSILNSLKPSNTRLVVKNKVYTILSQLGRGGSSVVHLVLDQETSKELAIKCVNLAGVERESAQGYLNEIKLLERLQSCDCVIKLCDYEYDKNSQTLYVVMEKGDTDFSKLLKDLSKTKKISSLMIAYYWTEMVTAVKCIHENGIIHSDLKPANFLLVSGRLKLIDFGIASSLNVDSTSIVKENILGTFNYISPEAIQGTTQMPETRKISFKSDIWSLGCILYNLVYGRTPFAHIVHTMTKLSTITNRNYIIKYPESAECPEIFLTIMKSCLQYRPIDRPTAEALLQVPFLPTLQVPLSLVEQKTMEKIRSSLLPNDQLILDKLLPK